MFTKDQLDSMQSVYSAGIKGKWVEDTSNFDDPGFKSISCYENPGSHLNFIEIVTTMQGDTEESPQLRANLDWIVEARANYPELIQMARDCLALKEALRALLNNMQLTAEQRALLTIGKLL